MTRRPVWTAAERAALGERDGWVCALCGKPIRRGQATAVDHLRPWRWNRRQGRDLAAVRLTHASCNGRRQDTLRPRTYIPQGGWDAL